MTDSPRSSGYEPAGTVCGIIVLRADGAALLQHRDDIPTINDPGLWVIPGGHVEPGETVMDGAVREVEEETCYRSAQPRLLADYHATELGYHGDFRMIFFWDEYDGAQAIECREGQAATFVRREDAEALPRRDYLTRIWDLALAAREACQRAHKPFVSLTQSKPTPPDIMELSHRTITQIGRYRDVNIAGIPPDTLRQLYRQMLRLRRTEEAMHAEYHPADEMRCPIHFCIGQESIPSALSLHVKRDDFMFSHHRSHGYFFAKGSPLRELFAEIYGKATGASGGKAGSQDISHSETHFYSGAILAGAVSIAVGAAFGFKHKKTKQIAISGFGEGCTDEGAFWEAMNYAGKQKLPVLFVCENNRYATFSDQLKRQANDNVSERVRPFGVRATTIFGNDSALAYKTIGTEIERLRNGDGPALIEAYTYRWNSHVGPEDDSANAYRNAEEIAFWKANCPIVLLGEKLREAKLLDDKLNAQYEAEIADEVAANFKFAKESPFPTDTHWRHMNYEDATPLADKLLGTAAAGGGNFNQYQDEAKLGPY